MLSVLRPRPPSSLSCAQCCAPPWTAVHRRVGGWASRWTACFVTGTVSAPSALRARPPPAAAAAAAPAAGLSTRRVLPPAVFAPTRRLPPGRLPPPSVLAAVADAAAAAFSCLRNKRGAAAMASAAGGGGGAEDLFGGGSGIIIPPSVPTATPASLIFLHGLGDSASGWASSFPLPGIEHLRVVLPTAGTAPVSLNGGIAMPSWFDLHGLTPAAADDEAGIAAAVARVERIIDAEVARGTPTHRIVLGGFSQGCAVAITVLLRSDRVLGGGIGLSGWLPMASNYPAALGKAGGRVVGDAGLLMCHGEQDGVVAAAHGKASAAAVEELGIKVTWRSFRGLAHGASGAEMMEVAKYLRAALPPTKAA
ncbi:hypothetical protein I4F81_007908 [Pyropia yezoensis]|uniref:Uncharacterized protein n=1 Tax=Pyropia yezoensis TaxID=2788 RepID=A0ACC3C5W5_PYRYE|nr:hypothetical protein I4F81_007908 [Neopyropia yezoensis]